MSAVLASIALNAGLPVIEKILGRKLGDDAGKLAAQVLGQIAGKAGVPVEQLDTAANANPGLVIDAMREVERETPQVLGLFAAELQLQLAHLAAERDGSLLGRAWRPAGMYLIGFLWLWNLVLLHIANAVWKIALPPIDNAILIQLSGLYMGLYMGGHTVKDVAGKLAGKWAAK